jgi:hypothetical protein
LVFGGWFVVGCLWFGWLVVFPLLVGGFAPHWPSIRKALGRESVNDCPLLPALPGWPFEVMSYLEFVWPPLVLWLVGLLGLLWLFGLVVLLSWPLTYSRRSSAPGDFQSARDWLSPHLVLQTRLLEGSLWAWVWSGCCWGGLVSVVGLVLLLGVCWPLSPWLPPRCRVAPLLGEG